MKDIIEQTFDAIEGLIEAVDNETILDFEAGAPLDSRPRHTKEYYIALQNLRNKLKAWRAMHDRR